MKLCILSNDYPSKGRPVYTFVEQLVNNLLCLNIDIIVIAPQSISRSLIRRQPLLPFTNNIIIPSGKMYKVYRPLYISVGNLKKMENFLTFFRRKSIRRIIAKENPDILYGHFWQNAYLLDGIARDIRKPLFVACGEGDNALEDLVDSMSKSRKANLSKSISGMISVSSENKRKCLEMKLIREDNVIVLPNCVETDTFRYDKSLCLRNSLGIKDDDFVIIYCGDFETRKGSNRLSDAIKSLDDEHIKSIYIGRPVAGENVDPTCKGVVFKGSVEHDDMPKYLNTADIFVLPTRKEGCCNAIVEALACGLPVISSDGAFNDDILDENNSIRVNPDDVDAIASAIKKLRDDKELRYRMRDYSIAKHNEYSLKNRAKKILQFIEEKR